MKTRKKWLRKTTAICTAALLGTAAIPSTAFAADSYASIEKDAWAKKVTEMASSYATSIEESQSLMSGMQSDMILKFEDSGRSLLGFVAPFDVSWLDNVTLSNDISFTEGKEGILMKVLLNDNKICTLEYYLDPDSQDIYMRIPELSDKYFKTNLEEAADQQAANIENDLEELTPDDSDADIPTDNFASAYSDSLSLTVSMMSDLSAAAPEASVVETLLDKYGSMLFDNVTEGESSQETLTAGDISQDCTVYEGQISAEDAVKTATAILEEAKSDSDIENILDTWTEKLSSNEDLHESFTKAVEDGLDFLKDADTGDSDDSHLNTRIWVDETGRIAGRKIEFQEGDKITPVLNWQMTRDGSDFGYLLSIETDDSGVLLQNVKDTKGAIGYVALSYLTGDAGVATVAIDGAEPTLENTYAGKYPVWTFEHMYTKGEPDEVVSPFLDYIMSDEYGAKMESLGYGVSSKMTNTEH